ncbi:MAG TPA: hypothetical protein VMM81_01900 [Acidimicrobiia bacterium]|nr:hypothetical protein [Acidimicrobiia bacterium]
MRRSAADLIRAGGIDPGSLAAVLPRVDPEQVRVRAARRWFRFFWAPWVTAMALPWGIYLHPKRLSDEPDRLGRLMVHELTHIDQWRRLGPIGWFREYLGGYRRGRRTGLSRQEAYRAIPLEVEARDIADRHG